MKTIKPNNNIKNNSVYLLTFLLSVLFTLNIDAKTDSDSLTNEMHKLEKLLFVNVEDSNNDILNINDIEVIELEEEVEFGFDTTKHLPENFNPLKGKNDLDWSTIELIEIEEEIEIDFDTKAYLPCGFDPYKGMTKNAVEVVNQ